MHDPIKEIAFVLAVASRGTVAPSQSTLSPHRTVGPSILPKVAQYDLTHDHLARGPALRSTWYDRNLLVFREFLFFRYTIQIYSTSAQNRF